MNIVPWLAFGLAAAGAVAGWIVAANKAGRAAVLENGIQKIETHTTKIEEMERQYQDDRLVHVEIKAELKSLRDGQRRIERTLAGDKR